jgi:hypothetical protein
VSSRLVAGIVGSLVSLVVACSAPAPTLEPLAAYEQAKRLAWTAEPKAPPVYLQPSAVPDAELIPYAFLVYVSKESLQERERVLWRSALREMPDAILVEQMKILEAPHLLCYYGLHAATESPPEGEPTVAILLREAPAILPLSIKEDGVVTDLRRGAEKSSIRVGDTIESIAGRRIEIVDEPPLNTSDHVVGRLSLAPGQPVELIGYRSGGARVEGTVEAVANPKSYLSLESVLDVSREQVEVRRESDGVPYWVAVPRRR